MSQNKHVQQINPVLHFLGAYTIGLYVILLETRHKSTIIARWQVIMRGYEELSKSNPAELDWI